MMKKRFTMFGRRESPSIEQNRSPVRSENESLADTAARNIKLFCEAADPSRSDGDEVTHLPVIVEAAESSPDACAAAARQIRKFMGRDYASKASTQYNAVMLIRILSDNPGPSFTKHLSSEKFRDATKQLLRTCQDPSVQQLLRETLNALEDGKAHDGNLVPLMNMWRQEKGATAYPPAGAGEPASTTQYAAYRAPGSFQNLQMQQARYLASYGPGASNGRPARRPSKQLPPPAELAGRIEEARSSARLLIQLTQTTPRSEVLSNDLMREFAERCQSAQRNLQGYMNCTEPAPDEDTFQTLIETCEKLGLACSKHQRTVLAARKEFGTASETPPPLTQQQQQQQQQPIVAAKALPHKNNDNYAMSGANPGAVPPSIPGPTLIDVEESSSKEPVSEPAKSAFSLFSRKKKQSQQLRQAEVTGPVAETSMAAPAAETATNESADTSENPFSDPGKRTDRAYKPYPTTNITSTSAPPNGLANGHGQHTGYEHDDSDEDLYDDGWPPKHVGSGNGNTQQKSANSRFESPTAQNRLSSVSSEDYSRFTPVSAITGGFSASPAQKRVRDDLPMPMSPISAVSPSGSPEMRRAELSMIQNPAQSASTPYGS